MGLKRISVADEVILKTQIRELYKHEGYQTCLQVAYELLISAQVVFDVLKELNETNNGNS